MELKDRLINWFWVNGRKNMTYAAIIFIITILIYAGKPSKITAATTIIAGIYYLIYLAIAFVVMIRFNLRNLFK